VTLVPSKRQPSKQRRAAQNRARAQALAARREAASQPARSPATSTSSSSSGASAAGRRPGLLAGLLGGAPRSGASGGGRTGAAATSAGGRAPGTVPTLLALVFGALSFVLFLFSQVPVDDRDEPLPTNPSGMNFRAVYLEARSILTGDEVTARDVSVFDAHGPAVLIYGLVPLAVVIAVFVAFRRSPTSRPLTIGMLAMAVVVLFAGGFTWFPSLIALAVGSFMARRAELPARMAEREQARQQREEEDEDEYDDEEYDQYDDEELVDEEELDEDEELVDEDEELDDDEEVLAEDEDVAAGDEELDEDEDVAGRGDVTDPEAAGDEAAPDEVGETTPRGRRARTRRK
jgi:hypothetical protein